MRSRTHALCAVILFTLIACESANEHADAAALNDAGVDAGDGGGEDSGTPTYTLEECLAQGGVAVGDPGDGSLNGCPNGREHIGYISGFIEGGYCCPIASDCEAQEATFTGNCRIAPLFYWSGRDCEPRSGCECEGEDCEGGFADAQACADHYLGCEFSRTCEVHEDCALDESCSYIPLTRCGKSGLPRICVERPESCDGPAFPVCGCDGQTYDRACEALMSGASIEATRACEE